ncbi:MAG: cyclic nucleotide-binding domain-containing protein [Candidatus Cloacimonetes bacterium]|nr:cyclic nucleotide-binding domain-containing protein [Candidatus Cloacimonadota bacterium]MCF7814050.1 cyclic nucleotide-binding domain-containing protein [Candidatus Cloacimonadota bacterium]MCF7868648.1 cyclic nucleotide-binding domain-containing protein [Candidatus Cloacimonadota bacterium]MCF7884103.1 cyclic nucleotide-binding domain-containing protein [Candidatus Cloacimonadota bacterium]
MEQNNREEKSMIKFLKKVSIFAKLSKSELKQLQQFIYTRHYKAGEPVFKKGYPNVIFFIVKEGEVRVYLTKKGEDIELDRVKPEGHFGSIGLFADVKRTASVEAVEDSVLLGISKKDLATFVGKHHQAGIKILYELGNILCDHIIKLNDRLIEVDDGKKQ